MAMQGKRTYTAIATVLVGLALKKAASHLPDEAASTLAPELVDLLGDVLATGGAAAAAYFRKLATPPVVDQQDVDTPKP
jgi:hypothetical protein